MRRSVLLSLGVLALAGTARAEEKEPPITGEGWRGDFLRAAHARVHQGWAGGVLRNAGERLPANHPFNDRNLSVVVDVTVIADGTIADARVQRSSGSQEFDAEALSAFVMGSHLPPPPDEVLSDDNRGYLRWTFARDRRACAGITVVSKERGLEESLPLLLANGRDREALRRVRAAARSAPDVAIGALARFWLERAFEQSVQSVPAATGLAALGDARGADVLRAALARKERVEEVAAALARLKLPGGRPVPARAALPPRSTETLVRVLRKGDARARAEAAAALAVRSDGAARQAVGALARDGDPALQLFGATGLGAPERAAVIAAVGREGTQAYRALAQGPWRDLAREWLLSQFDKLSPSVQTEALSHWLCTSREASYVTLSRSE